MPAASTDTPERRFAKDIANAIRLRELFFQLQIDRDFEADGGTIFYALDANVLNQYFRVRESSEDFRRVRRRFSVFSTEGEEDLALESQILDVVASFVLDTLPAWDECGRSEERPLLLLPGHSSEARRTYEAVVAAFSAQVGKSRRIKARLMALLNQLAKQPPERRLQLAQQHEPELHELLYSVENPHDKLRAYNRLLAHRRLMTLERAVAHGIFADFGPCDPREGADDSPMEANEGSSYWWSDRLGERMRKIYAEKDRDALSALDTLNRQLRHHKVRVVLLTLNDDIGAIGHRYRPYKYSDPALAQYHFSDLYIRHIRGFLSRPEIIRPTSQDPAPDVTAWLDAFLARVTKAEASNLFAFRAQVPRTPNQPYLDDIAQRALAQWPDLHQSLCEDWRKHLENVAVAHVSTSSQAVRRMIDLLGAEGDDRLTVIREFEHHVRHLTEDSWNDFFLTAAKSGYEMIGLSAEKTRGRKRNVPVVFFRDLSPGGDILRMIYDADGVIRNETSIRQQLLALDGDGSAEAAYTAAICYAVLFAYADRWVVAKLLARKAIYIAQHGTAGGSAPRKQRRLSGREANYLAAVTHRLTARRPQDLDEASAFLAAARKALKEEPEPRQNDGGTIVRFTGLRFAAEDAALQTAQLLFRAHQEDWEIRYDQKLIGDAWTTLKQIRAIIARDACEHAFVRQTSLINLRANLLACVFILEKAGVAEPLSAPILRRLAEEQIDAIASVYSALSVPANVSPLDFHSIVYALSFSGPTAADDPRLELWEASLGPLDEAPLESFLMPYDRQRCFGMSALAGARLLKAAEFAGIAPAPA